MRIINVFDAAIDGRYEDFISKLNGNINLINKYTGLNLLQTAVLSEVFLDDKISIIKYLISHGVDINYLERKNRRNALHLFYFEIGRLPPKYIQEVTKLLIKAGIDINAKDRYHANPLKYAVTNLTHPTQDIRSVYEYLIQMGADYRNKDIFNKSCLDYAKEFSWRNDFLNIVEETVRGR